MPGNRAVVYQAPGKVSVETVDYPELVLRAGPGVPAANVDRQCPHGVILKVVASNICGSDQHMVRGRTTAPAGLMLGHEITGEVIEKGSDVERLAVGDLVSIPFNVSCGRCRNCKDGKTGLCLTVNPQRPGGAYGYVDMGGWRGGQAEYVMVPYADWVALRLSAAAGAEREALPDKDEALARIRDLTMLSDIFPTGYHGCVTAGVTTGSTVYIAGAGPVGLAAATAAFLLGASVVIVGDGNKDRLEQARSFGCETVDITQGEPGDQIAQILGQPEVDCGIDCVGFEAHGHGAEAGQPEPATVLNSLMQTTRAGGAIGVPGLYVTGDPGAATPEAQHGSLSLRLGLGWAKSHSFTTGQCPVMRYHRQLMHAILAGRTSIARNVNAKVIPLAQAPLAYEQFDQGTPTKFVLDPHGLIAA